MEPRRVPWACSPRRLASSRHPRLGPGVHCGSTFACHPSSTRVRSPPPPIPSEGALGTRRPRSTAPKTSACFGCSPLRYPLTPLATRHPTSSYSLRRRRDTRAPSRMLATAHATILVGIEAHTVRDEVESFRGPADFKLVGLAEASLGESRFRVRSALYQRGVIQRTPRGTYPSGSPRRVLRRRLCTDLRATLWQPTLRKVICVTS